MAFHCHPDDSHIREHTLKDVASPTTAPLLNFLLKFIESETRSRDAEQNIPHRGLLLGNKGAPVASDNSKAISAEPVPAKAAKRKIPGEDVQNKVYREIINGPGLPRVPAGTSVTIVGGGMSGLVAGYELKRAGFDVRILEASSRVGGRVVTFRDPLFAPGLHCAGIPRDHSLLRAYINKFNIDSSLPFEMKNKFIYLSDYHGGDKLTYDQFNRLLRSSDPELLAVLPRPETKRASEGDSDFKTQRAFQAITDRYDRYTFRSYLQEVAGWSNDAIRLYDLGNAHVVYENSFIESWKDPFLSSNEQGENAGMQQLQHGMDQVPKAFISADGGNESLAENITYGARVTHIGHIDPPDQLGQVRVDYETTGNNTYSITSDYVILTVRLEQAIRDVRYVEVTKILLQYQKRWWENIFASHQQGTDGGLVNDLPIRYTMFSVTENNTQTQGTDRGVIMAAYTFQQDATILSSMPESRRIRTAAENLDRMFPEANSLKLLEGGTSQAFPADELAGGSAFCYFGPGQKSQYLATMCEPDWAYPADSQNYRVFLADEHASYTHGWIHGAIEAALRCVRQVHVAATSRPVRGRLEGGDL